MIIIERQLIGCLGIRNVEKKAMKELFSSKNSEILLLEELNVLIIRFIGDMTDEAYFEIWEKGLEFAIQKGSKRFIMDQSPVGHVSFTARSKVIMRYLPRYKKGLGKELKVGVLSSSNMIHSAGIKYMVKTFKSLTSFSIEFFSAEDDAIEWLKSV